MQLLEKYRKNVKYGRKSIEIKTRPHRGESIENHLSKNLSNFTIFSMRTQVFINEDMDYVEHCHMLALGKHSLYLDILKCQ